jgi:hypothetical protein
MLQRDSHFLGFFRDVRCDGETFAIMLVRNKNRNLPEERVERATLNNTFARRRQALHHSYCVTAVSNSGASMQPSTIILMRSFFPHPGPPSSVPG